mmetsp:Transcript_43087/g.113326  ORF Transcript_43087/g.113326 Transcript_43087/m.113326 type:complete len:277 (+) Transcript_43087:973-1803(+)
MQRSSAAPLSWCSEVLVPYTLAVLDALKVHNGPVHAEVMLTPTGPCLIEVNCRIHGAEGVWERLAQQTLGMNQIQGTVDCNADDPAAFNQYPMVPKNCKQHGMIVKLRTEHPRGALAGFEFGWVEKLPSYFDRFIISKAGDVLNPTTDLLTCPGEIHLAHSNKAQVEKDYAELHSKMESLYRWSSTEAVPLPEAKPNLFRVLLQKLITICAPRRLEARTPRTQRRVGIPMSPMPASRKSSSHTMSPLQKTWASPIIVSKKPDQDVLEFRLEIADGQ